MGPDCFTLLVDPAVRASLFNHRGKVLLPRSVVLDARPSAQGVLEYPCGLGVGDLGFAGNGVADGVELRLLAFDDEFEGAEIVAVFQLKSARA